MFIIWEVVRIYQWWGRAGNVKVSVTAMSEQLKLGILEDKIIYIDLRMLNWMLLGSEYGKEEWNALGISTFKELEKVRVTVR